jgi:hypothetical protein
MKLPDEFNVEAGLFFRFPDRSALQTLSVFNKSARKRPSRGRVLPLYQHNAAVALDDHIYRGNGVPVVHGACFYVPPSSNLRSTSFSGTIVEMACL